MLIIESCSQASLGGGNDALTTNQLEAEIDDNSCLDSGRKEQGTKNSDHLTPAEKILEQWEKINIKRLAKEATKSHRDRIQEFNRYLADSLSIMTFLRLVLVKMQPVFGNSNFFSFHFVHAMDCFKS
ncbi:hypothetical protein HAX54_005989 [Datura stramonium]|uniref:Uncharacterized protein n=1 Tax=Datura stramonium TaxID=4076 RepID=A0ABS8RJB4_DATST|nr:hypothetical protein [Datura stramonium]